MKKVIKQIIPSKYHNRIGHSIRSIYGRLHHNNLTRLAKIYQSDKWGKHNYTPHYQYHFSQKKNETINLFEIGVGGYDDPNEGGASLRMWKSYFKKGEIFSLDIFDKKGIEEKRIKTFKGSQDDPDLLKSIINEIGEVDIIIDDGSHLNSHIIKSFKILFPLLKKGGIYAVEDIQTSYWPEYGGSSDKEFTGGAVNFFKSLINGLNYKEFLIDDYHPSYFDENITSIHFYHNLIFIYKGDNLEESNILIENKWPYQKLI